MNAEEASSLEARLQQVAGLLEFEYAGYDVTRARLILEDLIIVTETAEQTERVVAAETAKQIQSEHAVQDAQVAQANARPRGWIAEWTERAACKGTDPDELFVQGAAQNRAKLICRGCPVRTECLAAALDNNIEFGVWGGMTERERRALLRRRPDVTSWRELLERARDMYERQTDDVSDRPA